MNFAQWLDLATAIILLFTLIAVLWYTFETRELRRVANKQLEVQLGHIRPFFQCKGGSFGNQKIVASISNRGGPAYYVRVSPQGDFLLNVGSQSDYVGAGEDLILEIQGSNLESRALNFKIEFSDGVGKKYAMLCFCKKGEIFFRDENK